MPEGGTLPLILGAVPAVAGLVGNIYLAGSADSRVTRRIAKDAELYKEVPTSSKQALEDLISQEVQLHIRRRLRKISWSAVATLIFVAAVTAAAGGGLAWLALNVTGFFWFVFAPVAFFGFALTAAGFFQLFTYPDGSGNNSADPQQEGQ
ncbi:hypothetical protein [Mycobacterium montefiorense]|uniref:DUF2721 domain-containing protein n=1 Tax=Mycobacterium montefiorense TaxID=154654 RepID=A0AA37PZF2_9MYCO|nr:hypothetical protein [Mycobacterium montefiorense]GBG35818.1 hypothetical protein MmonteBS_01900 [Mycobacterium montefiorense]GKU35968.1 hypothetical protein NJB14191_33140 [Mycobacterium montefiorense]GKU41574.1 hypothetical protein NJB14192_35580 [Mycobacterium montefiorense]GKU44408.1 hypothetical protein NJB14194_10360 [Mycobacterium montefiorense]GKU51912.1 hypothetical protein NJB14195_31560 [Mycobacterium montefiorense]